MVIKLCRKCKGSGNRVQSVKPLTFSKCNKCGGNGDSIVLFLVIEEYYQKGNHIMIDSWGRPWVKKG